MEVDDKAASSERWTTFVRKHAKAIVACDFFVSVTTQVCNPFVAETTKLIRFVPRSTLLPEAR
jgi:hypothetical protein